MKLIRSTEIAVVSAILEKNIPYIRLVANVRLIMSILNTIVLYRSEGRGSGHLRGEEVIGQDMPFLHIMSSA